MLLYIITQDSLILSSSEVNLEDQYNKKNLQYKNLLLSLILFAMCINRQKCVNATKLVRTSIVEIILAK